MGYLSSMIGQFTVEPPVNIKAMKKTNFPPDGLFKPVFRRTETETCDGTLIVTHLVGIEAAYDGQVKAYGLEKEFVGICRLITDVDSKLTGWMYRTGEDQGDVERFTMRDGKPVHEKAQLLWPDGSKCEV